MDINDRVKAIQETRANVWTEANGWLEKLNGAEMNAEEREVWGRYNERLDELQADGDSLIERAETETERAAVREAQSIAFGADPDDVTERRNANRDIEQWIRGEKRSEMTNYDGAKVNGISVNLARV